METRKVNKFGKINRPRVALDQNFIEFYIFDRCQFRDLTANVSLSNVTGMRLNRQRLKSKPSRKNGHASRLNANGSTYRNIISGMS